jgi:hypothetical protein
LKVKLDTLRSEISGFSKSLLDEFWQYYRVNRDWPIIRVVHSKHGTVAVREALAPLTGHVVVEEPNTPNQNVYRLGLLGILLTSEGPASQQLLSRYFEFERDLFFAQPEKQQITSAEVLAALKLSTEEIALLGDLIWLGGLYGTSGGRNEGNWTVEVMKEAEFFPKTGDLALEVEKWVTRHYMSNFPVFLADRSKASYNQVLLNPDENDYESLRHSPILENRNFDPMSRRYQVFVSSTYADLIEERKHAIQALLETKCIPSGMELFPAASTEQWELIQRVIRDCDYYVVIVAGRYGSIGPNDVSYTEMEFDYAQSIGRPILGFYHSDIRKLPGAKLEETDEGKRKLLAFTNKVKTRMCREWSTPDGLASAIKTAVLYGIESNPQPGWIRASSVPTWAMVRSLEDRIRELEGQPPGGSPSDKYPGGDDRMEFNGHITWTEAKDPKGHWLDRKHFGIDHVFKLTWGEVFLDIGLKPGVSKTRLGLVKTFGHALSCRVHAEIQSKARDKIVRIDGSIDGNLFDRILETFLARKLLRRVLQRRKFGQKQLCWSLTQKGIQHLAELQAVVSSPKIKLL